MSQLFYLPFNPVFSSRGLPVGAAKVYFYTTGTTNLQAVYADAGLTTPLQNPVPADAIGKLPNIYMPDTSTYRVRVTDALGNPMGDDIDPYYPGMAFTVVPNLPQLVAPTGSSLVGFQQSGTGAVTETVQAVLRREVWAESYGVSAGNTGTQNAAAFQAAINALPANGGIVRFNGAYTVDQIVLPFDPQVVDIQGSGIRSSMLTMGTAAGPLILCPAGVGRITGARIGGFTLQANPSSVRTNLAHVGIALAGFGKGTFHDIRYLANGSGTLGVLFEARSDTHLCYENVLKRIEVALTWGPSRVLYCQNGGTGSINNPNLIELRDSWIYGTTNIDVIADLRNSTRSKVDNCLLEDCPGAKGIVLGQSTIVSANWFESLTTNVSTDASASVDGSESVVIGNYFSGAGTNFIDTIGRKPLWVANGGGGQTVTGAGVTKVMGATADPAAPTLTATGGVSVTGPTKIASNLVISKDALGRSTFSLQYSITPSAIGYAQVQIVPPTGYNVESWNLGATRTANGFGTRAALQADVTKYNITFDAADAHEIDVRVTVREQ